MAHSEELNWLKIIFYSPVTARVELALNFRPEFIPCRISCSKTDDPNMISRKVWIRTPNSHRIQAWNSGLIRVTGCFQPLWAKIVGNVWQKAIKIVNLLRKSSKITTLSDFSKKKSYTEYCLTYHFGKPLRCLVTSHQWFAGPSRYGTRSKKEVCFLWTF